MRMLWQGILMALLAIVSGEVQAQTSGEAYLRSHAFAYLKLSKTSCYEGEPILATYLLYRNISTRSRVVRQPSFNGFSVQELTSTADEQYEETVKGILYKVDVIRRVILTPLQPGRYLLDSVVVEHVVSLPGGGGNVIVNAANPPQSLMATALPAGASGLPIGRFELRASLSAGTCRVGGTDTLQIRIIGSGHFESVRTPVISWKPGWKVYAPERIEDSLSRLEFPVQGSILYQWPITLLSREAHMPETVYMQAFDPDLKKIYRCSARIPAPKVVAWTSETAKKPGSSLVWYRHWLPFLALIPLLIAFLYFRMARIEVQAGARPFSNQPSPMSLPALTEHSPAKTRAALTRQLEENADYPDRFALLADEALAALPHPHEKEGKLRKMLEAHRYGGQPLDIAAFLQQWKIQVEA